MTRRFRDGEFTWRDWYVAIGSHPPIRGRQSDELDEVGTEQLPFDDDSNTTQVTYLPACMNCGWTPEASTDPFPERCPACWAKLTVKQS